MSDTKIPVTNLHVAMVVRSFSVKGGLELYTHKLVEGLLLRGLKVTVVCEESLSNLKHPGLNIIHFPQPPDGSSKYQRLKHYFQAASASLKHSGPYTIIHSQHLPVEGAHIATLHNHTIARSFKVGSTWERVLNRLKAKLVPAYRLRQAYDALLCRQSRCLIFVSQIMHDDFKEWYQQEYGLGLPPSAVAYPGSSLPSSSISYERPGSRISHGAGKIPDANDEEGFTFLFVGKGYRKKGLDVLLDACHILSIDGRRFQLLIAGLKQRPVDRLRLHLMGLASKVKYLGFREDMDRVYAQAQAFVMPSRLEPFGMAPLQAMQRGLAPIVSRVSGVSELLTHEHNALILNDHLNARELSQLMIRLIDEPDLLLQISTNARELAGQITWDNTIEATIQAYRMVLTKQEPSTANCERAL